MIDNGNKLKITGELDVLETVNFPYTFGLNHNQELKILDIN